MNKTKLTKREYIGDGYSYTIKNLETGEYITNFCTENEYRTSFSTQIPIGHEHIKSEGGFPLLNTQTGLGSLHDGFVRDNEYYVYELDTNFDFVVLNKYNEEEFNSKYVWQ